MKRRDRLGEYRPYARQAAFHAAGAAHRERLLRAGNQQGKTLAGAAEAAIHLTGRYPAWWQGRRWTRPVIGWAAGVTGEVTRDNPQRWLLGRPGDWGSGTIPAQTILGVSAARGIRDLADMVRVRHASGGTSLLKFTFYEKGREKWQGDSVDFVWFDEEPPADIYTEGLTRTNATAGCVWLTFTPLLGLSEVVRRFLHEPGCDRHDTAMTIDDALHIAEADRARIEASYPAHEREARLRGTPSLGSGRIFPIAEDAIRVEPFPLPAHWVRLGAMDFGWDHPTAAVLLAWDRDGDCAYVTRCYRVREATPVVHAAALRPWGGAPGGMDGERQWLPWAWPADGLAQGRDGGEPLAEQYRRQGLRMLAEPATLPGGSRDVEAGLMEMLDRAQTGRLKVFAHLADWFEEFRLYHRQQGRIVKQLDDLMDATRYGLMMLRHATLRRGSDAAAPKATLYDPMTW